MILVTQHSPPRHDTTALTCTAFLRLFEVESLAPFFLRSKKGKSRRHSFVSFSHVRHFIPHPSHFALTFHIYISWTPQDSDVLFQNIWLPQGGKHEVWAGQASTHKSSWATHPPTTVWTMHRRIDSDVIVYFSFTISIWLCFGLTRLYIFFFNKAQAHQLNIELSNILI